MADKSTLLVFLVFSSLFLVHEARTLHPSITKENIVTVVRKGGGSRGGSFGGSFGGSGGKGGSSGGKYVPPVTAGVASGISSHKIKHNAAHNSYNVSIASFLIISALWLTSLTCL